MKQPGSQAPHAPPPVHPVMPHDFGWEARSTDQQQGPAGPVSQLWARLQAVAWVIAWRWDKLHTCFVTNPNPLECS